jgi:2-polyprenyl-3-methyl-5-hydroxy-6-metoxy-1,4-benzoquinol methylase
MMNHFSIKAKDWDTDTQIQRNRVMAQAILDSKLLPKKKLRVLDFGCGTGLLSSFILERAISLVGIDNTPEMIELFDRRFKSSPQVRSVCIDLEKKNNALEGETFDLVVSAMAFHHLERPFEVLKLIKSSMGKDSHFYLFDLDQEDGSFHADPMAMGVHHFGFGIDTLDTWAKDLNFTSFQSSIVMSIEKNEKSYPLRMSVFVG